MQWHRMPGAADSRRLIALAEQAVASVPRKPGAWIGLARLQAASGDKGAAVETLRRAVVQLPQSAELRLLLAQALSESDPAEALGEAREALHLDPGRPEARRLLFRLLAAVGELEAAEGLAEEVAAHDPTEQSLFEYWGRRARGRAELEALVERCDAALTHRPGCTYATYVKARTLARLGEAEAARRLVSTDALVEVRDVGAPEGSDADTFYGSLAATLRGHPTLVPDPRGTTTTNGLQTGLLRGSDGPEIEALIALIRRAVSDYCEHLPASAAFARARPEKADLALWAVICGPAGRQRVHCHPNAWLSGVYYVAAPRSPGSGPHAGALLLGALDLPDAREPPWGIRAIEPVPGRLVLFPSYMPHATEASGVEGDRICVSFDVVPAD